MKKVILYTDNLGPGGAQRQLIGLAYLLSKEYNVKVLCYYDNPFYVSFLKEKNIKYELIKNGNNILKRIIFTLLVVIKEKPNTLIAYQETPSIIACLTRFFFPFFKLIVSERNTTQKMTIKEKIRFNLFRISDYVVPNSYTQETFIIKNCPFLASKTITISNFVQLNHFTPLYHRTNKPFRIIVAASVIPSKNTLKFIEAVRCVNSKSSRPFIVEWFGIHNYPSTYLNQCQKYISDNNLNNVFHLLPKTKNIVREYQTADALCLPSLFEGTPNTICEGIACGLPIICSDICDNSRFVHDGINGFTFDPTSIESMSNAITRLLNLNDKEIIDFGQYSRTLACKELSERKFLNEYLKII